MELKDVTAGLSSAVFQLQFCRYGNAFAVLPFRFYVAVLPFAFLCCGFSTAIMSVVVCTNQPTNQKTSEWDYFTFFLMQILWIKNTNNTHECMINTHT